MNIPVEGPNFIRRRRGFSIGETLHKDIGDSIEGQHTDKHLRPYCSAAKRLMRDLGVKKAYPEFEIGNSNLHGVCDVLACNDDGKKGVIEWKFAFASPERPRPRDLLQLACYVSLAAEGWANPASYWGALVYLVPSERKIRAFHFKSLGDSIKAVEQLAVGQAA
jgi:hypothetical protein